MVRVRYVAAVVCAVIAVLYLTLMRLVADAEAGEPENTYGAYLFLGVIYAIGAVVLAFLSRRAVWAIGVAVQVFVFVLFVMFGAGAFGPGDGVFDYAALDDLPMEWWVGVITGLEIVLLVLLAYLAYASDRPRDSGALNGVD